MEKDFEITLFMQQFSIVVPVYRLLCRNRCCTRLWNGEQECIFLLSRKVAAGWELGFEFVEQVQSAKQTFAGFVNVMKNKYHRFSLDFPSFMSLPTFISWWFAWASAMRIEFREPCSSCGAAPRSIGGDATKIGIGKK